MTNIKVIGKKKIHSEKTHKDYVNLYATLSHKGVDGMACISTFGSAEKYDKYEVGKSYDVVVVYHDNVATIYD